MTDKATAVLVNWVMPRPRWAISWLICAAIAQSADGAAGQPLPSS